MKKRKVEVVSPFHQETIDPGMATKAVAGASVLIDEDTGPWAPSSPEFARHVVEVTKEQWREQSLPQAELEAAAPDTTQEQSMLCRKHATPLGMHKTSLPSGDEVEVLWCDNCGTPAP